MVHFGTNLKVHGTTKQAVAELKPKNIDYEKVWANATDVDKTKRDFEKRVLHWEKTFCYSSVLDSG